MARKAQSIVQGPHNTDYSMLGVCIGVPLFRETTSQDPPCTLDWGYMVPYSRYLGPNRG